MKTKAVGLAALALLLATTVMGQDDGTEEEVLVCYTCTMSGGTDDSCYTDPDNSGSTPTTECKLGTGQCCLISRTDDNTEPDTPVSLFRGCVEDCDPSLIGKLVTTPSFAVVTYESYCNEDRCNNGPGNTKPGSSTGGGTYIDGIDGMDGAGTARPAAAALVLGLLCLCLVRRVL